MKNLYLFNQNNFVRLIGGRTSDASVIYQYANLKPETFVNGASLNTMNNLNYIGYEQSYSLKWAKGPSFGFNVYGLIGNSEVIQYNKYALRGFRSGIRVGNKFNFFNRVILEPNATAEYGNLRIKDKTADSRLKNNSMNLGINLDLRILPYTNPNYGTSASIVFCAGYLWKVPNNGWIASKNFNSQISAQPFNWSGWYFSVKIGVLGD